MEATSTTLAHAPPPASPTLHHRVVVRVLEHEYRPADLAHAFDTIARFVHDGGSWNTFAWKLVREYAEKIGAA